MAKAIVDYRDEVELHDLGDYHAPENIDVDETDLGSVTTVEDIAEMVLEANIDDLEESFQQKVSNIKFDTTIKNYLQKNLYETNSKKGKLEYFIKVDKDVKNKSVYKINVGNKKYVRAVKINDNGIVNGLTYVEQKLGKNYELIKFLKNKDQNIKQQILINKYLIFMEVKQLKMKNLLTENLKLIKLKLNLKKKINQLKILKD